VIVLNVMGLFVRRSVKVLEGLEGVSEPVSDKFLES
jgi:hypothetical protein